MENTVNTENATSAPETSAPAPRKPRAKRNAKTAVAAPKSRIVTATLPKRQVRVVFRSGNKIVHTSPTYNSGNILSKIIAYARATSKGAASGAAATAQVTTDGKKWTPVTE